jgi:hypothetical protein
VTGFHVTGFEICTVAIFAACLAGWIAMEVQKRRDQREIDAAAAAEEARTLPQRTPGVALDAAEQRDVRLAHLDAVWAQCMASRPYVDAMLASYEAEVTDLLELALEVDDQSPKPADDA